MCVPELPHPGGHVDIRSRVAEKRYLCVTVGRREHICFFTTLLLDCHVHDRGSPGPSRFPLLLVFDGGGGNFLAGLISGRRSAGVLPIRQ